MWDLKHFRSPFEHFSLHSNCHRFEPFIDLNGQRVRCDTLPNSIQSIPSTWCPPYPPCLPLIRAWRGPHLEHQNSPSKINFDITYQKTITLLPKKLTKIYNASTYAPVSLLCDVHCEIPNTFSQKKETSPSGEAIVSNDDVLSEILIRLPVRSLFRFKSVSKHWLSLITTHPALSLRLNPDPSSVSGVFLHPGNPYSRTGYSGLDFIPLNENPVYESRNLTVIPNLSGVCLLNSSHGLMIVGAYNEIEKKYAYHVLNPTTGQFAILPNPHLNGLQCLCLAFNPSRSPHYKVIALRSKMGDLSENRREMYYQIEIYSSETGSWRGSGGSFTMDAFHMVLKDAVYWNDAVHWWCDVGDSYYFNVEEERLGRMPMPPFPEFCYYYDRRLRYMFESRDHLHMIDVYNLTQFNVFEMERDYSEWFVKYRVDLGPVIDAFPKMNQILNTDWSPCPYNVLSLVRQKEDDKSYLLLHVPGKIVRYNLVGKTFEAMLDAESVDENDLRYIAHSGHQYIECYYAFKGVV